MVKGKAKKRKKRDESEDVPTKQISSGTESESDSSSTEKMETIEPNHAKDNKDEYKPYRVSDYTRRYPEDSPGTEFVVFVESSKENSPIGSRDMMNLNNCMVRFIKGIKYFNKINKYKIGVVFEKPTLANAFLGNSTFLTDYQLNASIPANSTEITGVVSSVPTDMTNKKIFEALSSNKKIICVRRIMKKVKIENNKYVLQPTQAVAITFASSSSLPEHVYLKKWRLPVQVYVPPVKQCFRCLRYGHMAKYCKNNVRCSICTEGHSFKECTKPTSEATCVHCGGPHIAISGSCPIKKQKILEIKNKASPAPYSSLFNKLEFPTLSKKENQQDLLKFIMTDNQIIQLFTKTIIKLITLNKSDNLQICTKTVTETLKETFREKETTLPSSQVIH